MDDTSNITFLEIAAMGLEFRFDFSNKGLFASYMRYPRVQGVIERLVVPDIKSQYSLTHFLRVGDTSSASQNQSELAAVIVFWNRSYAALRDDFCQLVSLSPYHYAL